MPCPCFIPTNPLLSPKPLFTSSSKSPVRPPICCTPSTPPPLPPPSSEPAKLPSASSSASSTSGSDLGFVGANRLGISFTCNFANCNTRITKTVSRRSYEKGTILIQCPECGKHHVIADNSGMYSQLTGGKKNVEEIARHRGVAFARVSANAFDLDNVYQEANNVNDNDTESEERNPPTGDPAL